MREKLAADKERASKDAQHTELDEIQEAVLVERAKYGDREAFGELARRHRDKMLGYAQSITREPFLAEDIVQEALIRAFLHMGTLIDMNRFMPWLHRIVRNQAYTKMNSAPVVREQTFTAIRTSALKGMEETDWSSLDSILGRLSRSASMAAGARDDEPEERFMRKQTVEMIEGMLRCLSRRERDVFESHFFHHLAPEEISKLFSVTPANVYMIISRSRKKLIQERTRVMVDHYMNNRKDMGLMSKVLLPKPTAFTMQPNTWTTAVSAMYGLLESTDADFSLPMLMGLTGQAFRINIEPETVNIGGPTIYHYGDILSRGLRNIGFNATYIYERVNRPEYAERNIHLVDPKAKTEEARVRRSLPDSLPEALSLIHRSLDRGQTVMTYDLFFPEFEVIYGYDDERRVLFAGNSCGHIGEVPYEHLGRGTVPLLFVLTIDGSVPLDKRSMVRQAMETILHHYQEQEPWFPGFINGIQAYGVWIEAFRSRKIEPIGNSYNTAVVHDARRFAAIFFNELSTWQDIGSSGGSRFERLCLDAATLYEQVANDFRQLVGLFPFQGWGEPNRPENAERAARLLESAQRSEKKAVELLEQLYKELTT